MQQLRQFLQFQAQQCNSLESFRSFELTDATVKTKRPKGNGMTMRQVVERVIASPHSQGGQGVMGWESGGIGGTVGSPHSQEDLV